jgi:hypothetical protein
MCLFDGARFPFDLTDLRTLDHEHMLDCLEVLRQDYGGLEVQLQLGVPNKDFERLAQAWNLREDMRPCTWSGETNLL